MLEAVEPEELRSSVRPVEAERTERVVALEPLEAEERTAEVPAAGCNLEELLVEEPFPEHRSVAVEAESLRLRHDDDGLSLPLLEPLPPELAWLPVELPAEVAGSWMELVEAEPSVAAPVDTQEQ